MKNIKLWHNVLNVLVMMILIISFASCSSSDDEPVQDGKNPNQSEASAANVIGRWMGSSCIKSLRGGYRYSYVTLDLNSDGTGQVKQENDDDEIIFLGEFTWTIADKKIQCQGVSASISGNVNTNFTTSFEYRDGRLYGIDRFEFYILGKGEDSFPCVNGDGEEIIDRSEFLDGVWVLNNGKEVLEIEVKDFNNYTQSYSLTTRLYFLSSNAGNSYDAMVEDKYAGYYLVENTLWLYVTDIDQKDCKIWTLTENELRLIYGDTDKTYTKGSYKDIPGKKNLDNILANIWVEWQDRITVLDLRTPGVYIEYTKDEAFSDRYIEKKVGSYSYDDDGKYLTFTVDGKSETWTIDYLLDTGMELSQNRKTWSFYRCYEDEIPTTPVGDNPDKNQTSYMYTPGDNNGWNAKNSQVLTTEDNDHYSGFVAVSGNGFKLTPYPNDESYVMGISQPLKRTGDNVYEGILDGTENISLRFDGLYYVEFTLSTRAVKLTRVLEISIVGEYNAWNATCAPDLIPNNNYLVWSIENIELPEGSQFRFCINHEYTISLGGEYNNIKNNGDNLLVSGKGGTNVAVHKYNITLNLSSVPYFCTLTRK